MTKKRKVFIITLISVTILFGGVIIMVNNSSKDVKQDLTIKNDKEPIINRFPNIGEFKNCYWMADTIGKHDNKRIPGPSGYWIKGFIEVDYEKLTTFIEKYNMKKVENSPQIDFTPENYDKKKSFWLFSDDFNNYIKPPSFFGKFYIDSANKLIYFDVKK
jgi:hypothetical protein